VLVRLHSWGTSGSNVAKPSYRSSQYMAGQLSFNGIYRSRRRWTWSFEQMY